MIKLRNLARQLAGFYRDLSSSFKGLDARIHLKWTKKGGNLLKFGHNQMQVSFSIQRKKQPGGCTFTCRDN